MPLPQLNVYRHDRTKQALITLAGEIDIDLTAVTFCDCSGLTAFLHASQQTTAADGSLRLHYPPHVSGGVL
jgi:anti-sigma B factor antagonist